MGIIAKENLIKPRKKEQCSYIIYEIEVNNQIIYGVNKEVKSLIDNFVFCDCTWNFTEKEKAIKHYESSIGFSIKHEHYKFANYKSIIN